MRKNAKKATKRTCSMALAAVLAFAPVTVFGATDTANHWANAVISDWESKGLIKGYEDGTFKPDNSVSRAEFVTMMNNVLKNDAEGTVSFTDVKETDWFYQAVAAAVNAGYCNGYEDGTFKPSATISRAEAAVMIANAMGLEQDAAGAEGFSDEIPVWAVGSVGAVVKAGYMSGYPDGTFGAAKSITRAEAVSSLNRVLTQNDETVAATEVVLTEKEAVLEDQVVAGNVVIDSTVEKATLRDVEIQGDLVIRCAEDDKVVLDNVTVKGRIIIEKTGVEVSFSGKTDVKEVQVGAVCELTADDFEGSIDTVRITKEVAEKGDVVIDVPVDEVVVEKGAALRVRAYVRSILFAEDAECSTLYVAEDAEVKTVTAEAGIEISGKGSIAKLEANADDITVDEDTNIEKTEVASGVEAPTTSDQNSGSSGGGSSSSVTRYTVTFDSDGGSAVDSQTVRKGNTASEPAEPTKDGFVFYGWFLDGVLYDFNTAVRENLTLTAMWGEEAKVSEEADEWKTDRSEPKVWSISDGWISNTTKTAPEEDDWYKWEGRKETTGADVTSDWSVETTIEITEDLQKDKAVRSSVWLNVTDGSKSTVDWAIMQYKYSLGEQSAADDTNTPAKTPVFQVYREGENGQGQWVDLSNVKPTVGQHVFKMQFHEGTMTQYIDGVKVNEYTVSAKTTAPQEIIFNSRAFAEGYTTRWSMPEIKYLEGISIPEDAQVVTTKEQLIAAAEKGGTVVLDADIALTTRLNVNTDLVIYGNGHKISADAAWAGTTNDGKHLIGVGNGTNGTDLTLNNVTLENTGKAYGLNVYENTGMVTLEDVTITGSAGSGITLNGGNLQAENLNISESAWQSIDVTTKPDVDGTSVLTLDNTDGLADFVKIAQDKVEDKDLASVTVGGEKWNAVSVVNGESVKYIFREDATGKEYYVKTPEDLRKALQVDGAEIHITEILEVQLENPANASAFEINNDVTIIGEYDGITITTNAAAFYIKNDVTVSMENITLVGDGADGAETGTAWMGIGTYDQANNVDLTMEYCQIKGFNFGMYFGADKAENTTTKLNLGQVDFTDCVTKAIYAENLTDSSFSKCSFTGNGDDATGLPSYAQAFPSAVDINLKYGDYSDINFKNCDFYGNGVNQGGALLIKARDDGDYADNSASLTDVTITDCTFTNNNSDIMLGEPDKNNAGPTNVTIDGVLVNGNGDYSGIAVQDNRKMDTATTTLLNEVESVDDDTVAEVVSDETGAVTE